MTAVPLTVRRSAILPRFGVVGWVASGLLAAFLLMAVAPGIFSPHDPATGVLSDKLLPPLWQDGGVLTHPLGTDSLGRDILSRIAHGASTSIWVALTALVVAGAIGLAAGVASGYFGGWIDAVLMRLTDSALSVPMFLIALMLAIVRGPRASNIVIAVSGLLWAQYARVIRAHVLTIRGEDYLEAARASGVTDWLIIWRHVLPSVLQTAAVVGTTQVGSVIIIEASLSFLGAGIPPPAPAWGTMVAGGRTVLSSAWWVSFFPGLAIFLAVVAFNLLGDEVQERLDPRLGER